MSLVVPKVGGRPRASRGVGGVGAEGSGEGRLIYISIFLGFSCHSEKDAVICNCKS